MSIEALKVNAITEEPDKVTLTDANASKERPKLDGFDMDEDTIT